MRTNRSAVLAAAVSAALASAVLPARASDWDGGDGTWSTSVGHWDGGNNWVQGSTATFPFTVPAGRVTLGEDITSSTITFDNIPYTIDLDGNDLTASNVTTLANVTGVGTVVLTNDNLLTPSTLTLDAIQSTSRFRLGGNMGVIFNGTSWTPASVNDFTGPLTFTGSAATTINLNRAAYFGSPTGTIHSQGLTTLNFQSGNFSMFETHTRDFVLGSTSNVRVTGVRGAVLGGSVSGTLNYNINGGMLVLAGSNNLSGAVTSGSNNFALVLAHDNALAGATNVNFTSSSPMTIGFMGGADGSTNVGPINIATGTGSLMPTGAGNIHNFTGDNRFAGNILAGSTGTSSITKSFLAEPGTTFTLAGLYQSGRGMHKLGAGTVVLTNANTFGRSNNSAGDNGTVVNAGTLRLDFGADGAPTDDIINNGNTRLTFNESSQLVLGGGTLEVRGKAGGTHVQDFANRSSLSSGFAIRPGASTVAIDPNGADSITLNLGRLAVRDVGGTIHFVLPDSGATVNIPTGGVVTASANELVTANGAAFASVNGTTWAFRAATGSGIVGGADALYTPNTATTLANNADMSGGQDTQLGADAAVLSLRFADGTAARSVDLNGHVLTTGGVLVSSNVGNHETAITGGQLRGIAHLARQDLVIFQHNTAAPLTISSHIPDNGAATGLTKSGAGTLVLTGDNTAAGGYTGTTSLNEGMLKLDSPNALGAGNLLIDGGVLGITSDLTRAVGTAADQVRFTGGGGFAAYGGDRQVTFGGSGVTWGSDFIRTGEVLTLGAADATGAVIFTSDLSLGSSLQFPLQRMIDVIDSPHVSVEATLQGRARAQAGITKTGAGTLELAATGSDYSGPTEILGGTLLLSGTTIAGTNSIRTPVTVHDTGTFAVTGAHAGTVDVRDGGTLAGDGAIAGVIDIRSGGTISPGGSGDGSLDVGALTLDSGSRSLFDITGAGDGSGANADTILAAGDVRFGGKLELNFGNDYGAGAWDLFNFATSTGDFASIEDVSGHYALLSFDPSTGVLTASAVPEPAAVGLLTLGGLAMLVRRGRTGHR